MIKNKIIFIIMVYSNSTLLYIYINNNNYEQYEQYEQYNKTNELI